MLDSWHALNSVLTQIKTALTMESDAAIEIPRMLGSRDDRRDDTRSDDKSDDIASLLKCRSSTQRCMLVIGVRDMCIETVCIETV